MTVGIFRPIRVRVLVMKRAVAEVLPLRTIVSVPFQATGLTAQTISVSALGNTAWRTRSMAVRQRDAHPDDRAGRQARQCRQTKCDRS